MRYLVFRDAATSFSFFFHNHHVISMTTSVSIKVTRKYSHSQEEYMRPLRSLLKSKNVVLKNVAVNVAGRKIIVIAAMIFITALSRDVEMATLCEDRARLVLVLARLRLVAASR